MAKKEETVSLIDTFSEFKELKNIDRTTMVSVLEESFRSVIAKMFGTDENYDVIVSNFFNFFQKKLAYSLRLYGNFITDTKNNSLISVRNEGLL